MARGPSAPVASAATTTRPNEINRSVTTKRPPRRTDVTPVPLSKRFIRSGPDVTAPEATQTMTPQPADIRRQIATLRLQTTALTVTIELALNHLQLKLNATDGYPSTASGAATNGTGGSSDTSSTEAAALARLGEVDHIDHNGDIDTVAIGAQAIIDELFDYLNAAVIGAKHALNIANQQAAGHGHTDRHKVRCKGTNDAFGATCGQWASPRPHPAGDGRVTDDGCCLDCGQYVDKREAKREAERRAETEARRARRYKKDSQHA